MRLFSKSFSPAEFHGLGTNTLEGTCGRTAIAPPTICFTASRGIAYARFHLRPYSSFWLNASLQFMHAPHCPRANPCAGHHSKTPCSSHASRRDAAVVHVFPVRSRQLLGILIEDLHPAAQY